MDNATSQVNLCVRKISAVAIKNILTILNVKEG
jgi:hypothetical protein